MGRLIFDLTDEDRTSLERLRIAMGLRSHADVLRNLIRREGSSELVGAIPVPAPRPTPPAAVRQSFSHSRSKTVVVEPKRARVSVPTKPFRGVNAATGEDL